MRKDEKNRAYTLVELCICLAFAGILIVFGLNVVRNRFQDYDSLYYNAVSALRKANYNVYADIHCREDIDKDGPNKGTDVEVADLCGQSLGTGDDAVNVARPYPTTSYTLCQRLKDYINYSSYDCGSSPSDNSKNISWKAQNSEFEDQKVSDSSKIRITTSSAYRIYLSDIRKDFTDSDGNKIDYFIAWVDINGGRKPNRVNIPDDKSISPDIIPVALTNYGDAIPLGYPVYSKDYMTVRIKFPVSYCNNNKDVNGNNCNISLLQDNYATAIKNAFGKKQFVDMPETMHYTKDLGELAGGYSQCEALSFFSSKIIEGTQDMPNEYKNKYMCEEGNYACTIEIDTYKNRRT